MPGKRRPDPFKVKLEALRRGQILDAASKVMARKGFRGTRMQEVADAAGVSNGTVYNYFASKDELLLALLDRLNETDARPAQLESSSMTGDPRERLERLMQHRFEHWVSRKHLVRALLPVILGNEKLRRRYLAEVIGPTFQLGEAAFKELGLSRPQTFVRALAASVFGLVVLELLEDDASKDASRRAITFLSELFGNAIAQSRGSA